MTARSVSTVDACPPAGSSCGSRPLWLPWCGSPSYSPGRPGRVSGLPGRARHARGPADHAERVAAVGARRRFDERDSLESGKLKLNLVPVDLVALASHAIETARVVAQGQTIHLHSRDEPVVVSGDAPRLEDVLLNLLTNAIKYAPGTGRIEVRLRRKEGQAEISVEDYGPGIASEDLPHIFSRFYQVTRSDHPSQSGFGLGLYIVHETVMAHGGRIEVRPGESAGTIFTVWLPLVEESTRLA